MTVSHTGAFDAVTVTTSATLIVSPKTLRKSVIVQNNHASADLYLGLTSAVTTSNGFKLDADDAFTFDDYNGPVYGIGDGASIPVRYVEIGAA